MPANAPHSNASLSPKKSVLRLNMRRILPTVAGKTAATSSAARRND
jgi:hypothetical protein